MSTCHCGRPIRDNSDECRRCAAIERGRTRQRHPASQPPKPKPVTPRTDPTIPDVEETRRLLDAHRHDDDTDWQARVAELRQQMRESRRR